MGAWDRIKGIFGGRKSTALARMTSDEKRLWRRTKRALKGGGLAGLSQQEIAAMRKDLTELRREIALRSYMPQDLENFSTSPDWSDFNPRTVIDNGLELCVWVARCVQICAMATASVPILAERKDGDQWVHEPESPLQKLINRPNSEWSWPGFIARVVAHSKLSGESYINKFRSGFGESSALYPEKKLPIALWAYLADRFAPRKGSRGGDFVRGYKPLKTGLSDVAPEDMFHFKLPHPDDDWHGLAEAKSTMREIDTDVEASAFQKLGLQNRAVFDGILSFEGATLDDEQWEETLDKFLSRYAGGDNARKILVKQDVTMHWEDMAKSAVDLDFIDGRKLTREGICAGFGVPPVLVGILDRATYSNYENAVIVFWQFTIIPFLDLFLGDFNANVVAEFGTEWRARYDVSGIDALFPLFEKRLNAAIKLRSASGIPWSLLNERFSLGLPEWNGWDLPTSQGGTGGADDDGGEGST